MEPASPSVSYLNDFQKAEKALLQGKPRKARDILDRLEYHQASNLTDRQRALARTAGILLGYEDTSEVTFLEPTRDNALLVGVVAEVLHSLETQNSRLLRGAIRYNRRQRYIMAADEWHAHHPLIDTPDSRK